MEISKINQIIDLRQSPQWGEYLSCLGWKKHCLDNYKNIYFLHAGPLNIAKMQHPADLSSKDLKEIDTLAQKNKLSFVKIEPSLQQNQEILTQAEYKFSSSPLCPPSTIFIDLKNDLETLRSNLSKTARYSINRSKKEGGRVEVQSNPSSHLLSQIYSTLRDTAKTQKFLIPSLNDLKTKLDLWGSECHVAVVKNAAGILCGVNIFLGFERNVWHIHGGTTTEGRKTKLGYLLLWESILYLKSKGYQFLDLEGKNDQRFPAFTKNWGGFSYFKEKFGGIEVAFPCPQIKYYNPVLKILSQVCQSAISL